MVGKMPGLQLAAGGGGFGFSISFLSVSNKRVLTNSSSLYLESYIPTITGRIAWLFVLK